MHEAGERDRDPRQQGSSALVCDELRDRPPAESEGHKAIEQHRLKEVVRAKISRLRRQGQTDRHETDPAAPRQEMVSQWHTNGPPNLVNLSRPAHICS